MPEFIDFPTDGIITQGFGGTHGGVDIASSMPVPVYAAAGGYAERHSPGDGFGDGSFGYHVVIDHGDGWFSLVAHLQEFALPVDGPVQAGARLGLMGYSGYTVPSGPGGRHTHWGMCRRKLFPRYDETSAALFADPRGYLISEADRMALFQRLERVEQMLGGEMEVARWTSGGNVSIPFCLGDQPARLRELFAIDPQYGVPVFDGIRAQTYGTNTVLLGLKPQLQALGVAWPWS